MSLLTNLVAAYTFENNGDLGNDDGTNNFDLTLFGSIPQATGNAAPGTKGVSFANDGANQFGTGQPVDGNTSFSCVIWCYVASLAVAFDRFACGQWQAGSTEWQINIDNITGEFQMLGSNNGGTVTTTVSDGQGSVSLNTWYMVTGYFDKPNQMLGVKRNLATSVEGALTTVIDLNTGLTVGGNSVGGGFPWDGRLDALALWTRLLTSDDYTALYNGGAGLEYPFPSGRRRACSFYIS